LHGISRVWAGALSLSLAEERPYESFFRRQSRQKKKYKEVFAEPRAKFAEAFTAYGGTPPDTFRQATGQRRMWRWGKWLYDPVVKADTSEATVKEFMQACPPFRAAVYALLMSYYNSSLRHGRAGGRLRAGGNDLLMSAYLPYCHKFVTGEKKREQEKCLREFAAEAKLDTEILSYDDFRGRLLGAASDSQKLGWRHRAGDALSFARAAWFREAQRRNHPLVIAGVDLLPWTGGGEMSKKSATL
jgi:hypothetical protein